MAILHWFSTDHQTATVKELSTQLDIPKATVYRIINDLKEWRVIEYDARAKGYRLGPRLLEFSRAYSQSTSLTEIARPYVTKLRDRTGETVSLNIVLANERICIKEARSIHALNWSVPLGTRGPLYAGSTGKAILAFMNPEELQTIRETLELKSITPVTPTDWDTLEAEFEEIRDQGYCTSEAEVTPGVGGLAAPLLNERGHSFGSINLSAPLVRWEKESVERYVPLVKETARAISREYGGG